VTLNKLSRRQKRYMFLSFDSALVPVVLVLAYVLRFGDGVPRAHVEAALPLLIIMSLFGPVVAVTLRRSWAKLMALDMTALGRIALAAAAAAAAARSIPILLMVLFFTLSVFGRIQL